MFAFGLSEKTHGADIYSTDMLLTPDGEGGFRATGSKYYIGNGNAAGLVSVFGRRTDVEGPDGYVFFAADSRHPAYHLVKNVVDSSKYVSEFRLEDYPVAAEDVLHTGRAAFDAALNTVNVGKFNLCTASIGICEHAMYEAVTHAHNRVLYGRPVTAFPHVRRELTDAYVRLVGMKLFSDRAVDYFRTAGPDDRRYLLFNPMTKMKVTTEGEKVIDLMWDVIAAKGFEKDNYFAEAAVEIRGLPKLEGTVHVNLALILKFMGNHLLDPVAYEPVPTRLDAADDAFSSARARPAASARSASTTGAPPTTRTPTSPTSPASANRPTRSARSSSRPPRTRSRAATSTCCSPSASSSRSSSTDSSSWSRPPSPASTRTCSTSCSPSWSATSPRTPSSCTARTPRPSSSSSGRSAPSGAPSSTRRARAASGSASRPFRARTR